MDLYGVRIPTIVTDNKAGRCSGCGEVIEGRPWRVSILEIAAPESPVPSTESAPLNPGPFEELLFFDHPSGRNRIYAAMRWKAENLGSPAARAEPPAAAATNK